MKPLDQSDARFATTHWTLVDDLRGPDGGLRNDALHELCRRYWPPVYGYLRRSGHKRELAAELTQGFFADVVLWRDLFAQADRQRGRMRTLVLAALKRYLIDQHRRATLRKTEALPDRDLDSEERLLSQKPADTADAAFTRRWALAVLEASMHECERHFVQSGKPAHWRLFETRILNPARGAAAPPLAQAALEHGFPSPAAAAAALQVVRDRFAAILREAAAFDSDPDSANLLTHILT